MSPSITPQMLERVSLPFAALPRSAEKLPQLFPFDSERRGVLFDVGDFDGRHVYL